VKDRRATILALGVLAAGAALVLLALSQFPDSSWPVDSHRPSPTPAPTLTEPILPPPPTVSGSPVPVTPSLTVTAAPLTVAPRFSSTLESLQAARTPGLPTPTSVPSPTVTRPSPPTLGLLRPRQRLGASSGSLAVGPELAERLGLGWYLDWAVRPEVFRSSEVAYMPMVRLADGEILPDGEELREAARAMPGALWLIGNEPDVKWQDNVTPEDYAAAYQHLYALLKEEDPRCLVAIGGVSQPTPLRLRYLDRILAAYERAYGQPMPVDVWNVHNFILREERDSWGVDIPPGMDDQSGRLFEITDHDDLATFQQQIIDFRRWMVTHGEQNKPLIVTEYGILMPAEYGFRAERVEEFMVGTFDFFRTAIDPALGQPADGYRLVQRWCWYSVYDARYPTGNLVGRGGGTLTPLGQAFARYASSLE
jgi:hypothetical protein